MIAFTVYGVAAPKGSGKAIPNKNGGKPIWRPASKRTAPWEESVVAAAVPYRPEEPLDGPLELWVTFYLPRPKSLPKHITEPTKRPDKSKLVRCLEDGLTRAGIWTDDARVVFTVSRKAFAAGPHDPQGSSGIPRAEVKVREAQAVRQEMEVTL
jgi:Holliday junction resolvase RusA-like endonuclease